MRSPLFRLIFFPVLTILKRVEIASIKLMSKLRLEGRCHLSNHIPPKSNKKRMSLYLIDTQSMLSWTQHPQNKQFGLERHLWRIRKSKMLLPVDHLLTHFLCILVTERRVSEETFVHNHPNAPNIHPVVVALLC
jgi:hypothetical protein